VVESNSLIMFLSLLPFEISFKFNAEVRVIALLSLFLIRFVKEVPVESCKLDFFFFALIMCRNTFNIFVLLHNELKYSENWVSFHRCWGYKGRCWLAMEIANNKSRPWIIISS
jgi:hypothetical protein